ncbi:MAG: peptidoglycan D,D-transpeptidase FtsI family protein [Opitutales bacterium]
MSRLIETHSARNPRLLAFHGMLAAVIVLLVGGLAWRQLFHGGLYSERERLQNQRRIIVPGPRGNILDREGKILVGNRPRFSVVLNLAELRGELRSESIRVMKNYRDYEKADRPTPDQVERIARTALAQRYLDHINFILGRSEKINSRDLDLHFTQSLLLPYVLVDDLTPSEYARLIERLPVASPLQVYISSARFYRYGSAAAHVLGYVGVDNNPVAEDFPGEDLHTFKMKGAYGRDGLEKKFDEHLQGEAGGAIYRVDPAGFKVDLPIEKRLPVQGQNLTTSLDIDLQLAADEAFGDQTGAVVALDVRTGEILAMTSKPDYDLNAFVPRLSSEVAKKITDDGAWLNQAIAGAYPPGSTFKLVTAIAAMRSGRVGINQIIADCDGSIMVGNKRFTCDNGRGQHGVLNMAEAIAVSCDVYFYEAGRLTTPDTIAAEARRFHLDQRTGIELAGETDRMLIPDPAWKEQTQKEKWFPGDTANMAIGQGFVVVTPLEMACFAASLARNELYTKPTILHDPAAPVQHAPPIGLTPEQRAALLAGMEGCTTHGTAAIITKPAFKIPGVRIAGKTGTAQKRVRQGDKVGNINCAWFICFAPIEHPEIAVAVMIEGDTIGEEFGGGMHSAPVANAIIKKYMEKKAEAEHPTAPVFRVSAGG